MSSAWDSTKAWAGRLAGIAWQQAKGVWVTYGSPWQQELTVVLCCLLILSGIYYIGFGVEKKVYLRAQPS